MLQASEVEHADAAVLAAADKDVDALGTEAHVVDLLVVRNQLRLGRQRRDVPYRAGGVDAGGDDEAGRGIVARVYAEAFEC